MNAPEDPEERRKFEASIFIGQDSEVEQLKPVQKHNARLLLGNTAAIIIQDICDKYDLKFTSKQGKRDGGVLGSYPSTYEIADTFFRLNNGVSLSAMTLARVKAADRKKISEIGAKELFKKSLTKKAMEKYDNEMLVVKSYMMLQSNGDTGLEMKDVRQCMADMKITEEDSTTLSNVFDRILSVHDQIEDKRTAKRIFAKTHLISIVPFIKKSIDEGRNEEDDVQWLSDFYNNGKYTTKSDSYNSTVRCGTSKKESVKKRYLALEKSYNACMQHIDARRNFHAEGQMIA